MPRTAIKILSIALTGTLLSGLDSQAADLVVNSSSGQTCRIVLDACGLATTPDGLMLAGSGAFDPACPQGTCPSFPFGLSGPATVRRGVAFTVSFQALNVDYCTSDLSSVPGPVTGWPTTTTSPHPTICSSPQDCGATATVNRTLTATALGQHRISLICFRGAQPDLGHGPYFDLVVTP